MTARCLNIIKYRAHFTENNRKLGNGGQRKITDRAFILKNLSCLLEYPEMVIRRLYDTLPTHFSVSRGPYFIEIGEVIRP